VTEAGQWDSDTITNLADEVMFSNPFPRYAELRQHAPVSRVLSKQLVGSGGYMLTRYDDVMLLLSDPRFSSDPLKQEKPGMVKHLPRMLRLLTDSMVFKDDPDHARLRRLVNKAFTPRMVQEMVGDIERVVNQSLDALDQRQVVDLVSDFAIPLPLAMISRMLGVSDDDRQQFHSLVARFVAGVGSASAAAFARTLPTARKLMKLIERMVDDRRTSPDEGLISALVEAGDEQERLSEDEIVAMIFLLMLAGFDTTSNLIGSSVLALLDHPEQAARLRGDPAITASAVEELLRFTSPVACGSMRHALEDIEVGVQTITKGSKVLGMIISANRDDTVFDNPDQLDLGRQPNRHISFAFGKHFCLGNQLARMEGQVALGTLVRRYPDMSLAVPREQLAYKTSQSLRGLKSLPMRLH
jgi:cytochrome P450 PksS